MTLSRMKILLCVGICLPFLVAPFALDIFPDGKAYASKYKHGWNQSQYNQIEEGEQSETHSTPEPTTMLLLGFGLVGLAIAIKKFRIRK